MEMLPAAAILGDHSSYQLHDQECVFKLNNDEQGEASEAFNLKKNRSEIIQIENTVMYHAEPAEKEPELEFDDPSVKQLAVCIRSACKKYGTKKDPVVIMDKLNMTVPKGIVYGLLGASGCGKTTLLSCLLGLKSLHSGNISVLGRTVGSSGSDCLGSLLGYMPQEMALYGDFTIRETIRFFGWIAGMNSDKIQERMEFVMNLLLLPDIDQRVKNLSGGQQRRVSLATALLHEPELLILDEPTVGLDSVLRENIWNLFSNITKDGHTTVIITTHYIDEATKADCVAIMRRGRFLAEDAPDILLKKYGLETLETLFLKLSCNQDIPASQNVTEDIKLYVDQKDTPNTSTLHTQVSHDITSAAVKFSSVCKKVILGQSARKSEDFFFYKGHHMKALFWKNFLWTKRHAPLMLSLFISPFIIISIFWICIGKYPAHIPIAVVNYDTNTSINCEAKLACNSSHLSCYYLKYIQEHDITLISHDTESAARSSVLKGESYAFIAFQMNYSAALHKRVDDWQGSESWDILYSEIDVVRDVSYTFASHLKQVLYQTFQNFLRDYMMSCDSDSKGLNIPIRWETEVYGNKDSTFGEFVITGLLILYICLLAAHVTVCTTMIERTEGLLERILVIGVTRLELLTSHLVCQFMLISLQSAMSLVCLFFVFNVTMKGSHLLVTLLTLLSGWCGMFYGLCLSCACNTEQTAAYVIAGSGFILMVLAGTMWPLEGMHPILRPLATYFPLTQALESIRNVMLRGWGIRMPGVYMGFVTLVSWTVFFLLLSILFLKFRKY